MTQRQNGGSSGSAGYRSVNLSEEERDSFCRGVPAIKPSHSPTNRLSGLTISFDNPHPETNHQVPTPYSGNRTPHFQGPFGSSKASSTVAPGKRFAPPACCSYRSRMLKKAASVVLASFRSSTGTRPLHHSAARTDLVLLIRRTVCPRGYPSGLQSLRPWPDNLFEHPAKVFSPCLNGKREHRETRIL